MVGRNNLWSSGTRYNVAEVTRHQDYNDPRLANDIAIVTTDRNIEFNDKVQPINISNEPTKKDTTVQTIGWGQFGVSFDLFLPAKLKHVCERKRERKNKMDRKEESD